MWLAEQLEPLRRDVALKVMRQERRGALEEIYFEVERQALARLSHRAIAQIHDAGRLPDGSLFFAMEYVPGVPLDEFVREQRPSPSELARLFIEICLGVQHAHQRGLIHRDLKPGNLLVHRVDGVPLPKIIDFGIATSVTPSGGSSVLVVVGTRQYMSPEQLTPDANPVDARTDVYALGAVLAQCMYLLAGVDGPDQDFDSTTLRQALTLSLGHRLPQAAGALARDLRQLHTLPVELRAIAVRAMAEDREQRYPSASALGEDLGRWLAHQPVQAMGESGWYNLRCGLRRNALLSTALITGVLALGAFAIVMTLQASRIAREAERANQALEELQAVTRFQTDQLRGIDAQALGKGLQTDIRAQHRMTLVESGLAAAKVDAADQAFANQLAAVNFVDIARNSLHRGIFERSLSTIRESFADRPAIRAELLQSSASAMRELGLLEEARAPQDEALAILRQVFGNAHDRTAISLNLSGILYQKLGKFAEAEVYFREAMAMGIQARGERDVDTIKAMANLAALLQQRGAFDEADPLYQRVLALQIERVGPNHPDTIWARGSYALMKLNMGDFAAAEADLTLLLAQLQQADVVDHTRVMSTLNNLASALWMQGKPAAAEPYIREAIEIGRRTLGQEHPQVLNSLNTLGAVVQDLGRLDEAEALFRKVWESRRRMLGENHADTLTSERNLGSFLTDRERLAEAEPLLRHAAEQLQSQLGTQHAKSLNAVVALAELLRRKQQPAAAVAMLRANDALTNRGSAGSTAVPVAFALATLGRALQDLGGDKNLADAQEILEEAYALMLQLRGAQHADTRTFAGHLASFFEAREAAEPGIGHAERALEWRRHAQSTKT